MTKMRVAFVQDWFTVDGGAEKVTKEILELYPQSDIFSLIDYMSDANREKILKGKKGRTSFIQKLPFSKKNYRWYLPLFSMAIESFDLKEYDLIISSSYSVAKGVKTHQNQKHICYCHSPLRYAWDLQEQYLDDMAGKNILVRPAMKYFLNRIKKWDRKSSDRVNCFVANSNNVKNRIARNYNRDSEVIYPPVSLDEIELNEKKEDFYLASSRQVPYKRTDIIIEAFSHMPDKRLIVTGEGPMLETLRKKAENSDNIEILGHIPREKLLGLMSNAKAFINASLEDFGISPIEALASGSPVIGYGEGGLLETTSEGKTAIYFKNQKPNDIIKSVKEFEKSNFVSPFELRKSVEKFDKGHFRTKFKEAVDRCLVN